MPDCYIADAWRTPFARLGGPLASLTPQDLARQVTLPVHRRCPKLPGLCGLIMGNVLNGRGNLGRYAVLAAELPSHIPGVTIDRQCASSMESIAQAARDAGISERPATYLAGGVESMSQAPFLLSRARRAYDPAAPSFEDVPLTPPGVPGSNMIDAAEAVIAAERVAREHQDEFALHSHQRANAATESGAFAAELEAVTVDSRRHGPEEVTADHGPRRDTSIEQLNALKPVRGPEGRVTAGNASGISDGGSMTVVMNEPAIERAQLTPLARIRATACVGLEPQMMGLGPVKATDELLSREGIDRDAIACWEINEAFAGQVLACTRQLRLDADRINPDGGAIALGHPLGASGARIAGHLAHTLTAHARGTLGVAALCIGGGMGMAMLLEAV